MTLTTLLSKDELKALIMHQADTCVSIFMPTHKAGRERQQDAIRLKNLLADAEQRIISNEIRGPDVRDFLAPLELLKNDDAFWMSRQDGLALFNAPDFVGAYRLPLQLDTELHVSDRFYIRPLLPLLYGNGHFFVLALEQNGARLFEATRYSIHELDLQFALEHVKRTLPDKDTNETLQFRTYASLQRGKGPAMFHGHGGAADATKQTIVKYFQAIDRAVQNILRGQQNPLVLACVGYLAPIYESTNSYRYLVKGKVPGNPQMWNHEELRDRAWQLVAPLLDRQREDALARYRGAVGSNRISDDLREIVLAATDGRVEVMFVQKGRQVWGNVDPKLRAVQVHDGAQSGDELLDYAAARTVMQGGDVYAVDADQLPATNASPAAALLRYVA